MDKKISLVLMLILVIGILGEGVLVGGAGETPDRLEPTVCCEETNSGLYCQDVPAEDCASERQPPTSCASTAFCKRGWCYNANEGTCGDGTSQFVCEKDGGFWSAEKPAQCELGCCVLGDQASFVTLVRCKRLSAFYGLETNYNSEIRNEGLCLLTARAQEKGACVYIDGFEKTCKFTTRSECESGNYGDSGSDDDNGLTPANGDDENGEDDDTENGDDENDNENGDDNGVQTSPDEGGIDTSNVGFHGGLLCSAEDLGTNCGRSDETICLPGMEEVYFVDTCGNPANIYDADKRNNNNYWTYVRDKSESCGFGNANEESRTCGNCDYLQGTYCREATAEMTNPTYGDNICASLNCKDTGGEERQHGESWCSYDGGLIGRVGSRYYRQICINGEVVTEPCADFRQEVCIQNTGNDFTEAACRVNRWQDCTSQTDILDCLNKDVRDCIWLPGIEFVLMGIAMNGSSIDQNSIGGIRQQVKEMGGLEQIPRGACVARTPPGLMHWQGEEAQGICGQANAACPVTYEKGLVEDDWECVEHCECLPGGPLEAKRAMLCTEMGDCGLKVNFVGMPGRGKGYEITEKDLDDD